MTLLLRLLGAALVGAGLVLAILGLRAHDSMASSVARLFSGSPTKESVLLLAAGGAGVLAGMVMLVAPGLAGSGKARRARRR
ncbi:MAG: DUF3185 family protein [Phycisphaerales bacterium]